MRVIPPSREGNNIIADSLHQFGKRLFFMSR
jgi:hypothetical protein